MITTIILVDQVDKIYWKGRKNIILFAFVNFKNFFLYYGLDLDTSLASGRADPKRGDHPNHTPNWIPQTLSR